MTVTQSNTLQSGQAMLPQNSYQDEVVLITGGGTGLGKAMAIEFGRLGAKVAIGSRDATHREKGVAAVSRIGAQALGVALDVRESQQITRAFDEIESGLGPVSVIVNNAAGNFPVRAEDLSPNAWTSVLNIGLNGTFLCSREFGRRAIAAGRPGAILNISSPQAWTGGPGSAHNASSKAGIEALTKSLAIEWAPYGIRVNSIAPGFFPHDDQVEAMKAGPAAPTEDLADYVPLGRTGKPHELAWAATYLCSGFAAFITGHTLVIDGGHWLGRGRYTPKFLPISAQVPKRERVAGSPS